MDFAVRPGFSEDGKKIVLVAQGGYFARVALEDIRKEFGFRVQDELLHDLASQREVNRRTLSEIATKLFEAEQYSLIQGYLPVADINRSDLAARKNQFAWGRSPFPEVMGIVEPDPPKILESEPSTPGDAKGALIDAVEHLEMNFRKANEQAIRYLGTAVAKLSGDE